MRKLKFTKKYALKLTTNSLKCEKYLFLIVFIPDKLCIKQLKPDVLPDEIDFLIYRMGKKSISKILKNNT